MNRPLAHPLVAERPVWPARFTAAEFVRMGAAGAFDDMKVELIGGELTRMNPPMSEHGRLQVDVVFELRTVFKDVLEVEVFAEVGITLDEETVLGCDAAVAYRIEGDSRFLRPEDLVLVVEVATTTLSKDMGVKRLAYASAGVAHYWVIDAERRVTHVYGDPVAGDYAEVSTVRFGRPLAVPGSDATIQLG